MVRLCQDESWGKSYEDWRRKERARVRVLPQAVLKLPILQQQYMFSFLLYIYDIRNLTHTHTHTHTHTEFTWDKAKCTQDFI
jgi:hypothetical protein